MRFFVSSAACSLDLATIRLPKRWPVRALRERQAGRTATEDAYHALRCTLAIGRCQVRPIGTSGQQRTGFSLVVCTTSVRFFCFTMWIALIFWLSFLLTGFGRFRDFGGFGLSLM